MNNLTRVYEALELAKEAQESSMEWYQKGVEYTKQAQDLCTHPAFRRKHHEDEFGSRSTSDYTDTCLICGKDVTRHQVDA